MTRRLSILVAAPVALALAAPGAAQQVPTGPAPPPPTPKDARMTIAIKSGRSDRGTRWEITGHTLRE